MDLVGPLACPPSTRSPVPVIAIALVVTALALAQGGCARQIGDGCSQNIDCSPMGDRVCDFAQPGGYCTQEDCVIDACPDESACVRYLALTATPCFDEDGVSQCRRGEICLEGFCAPLLSERRACLKTCESNDDCRDGYQCLPAGIGGAQIIDVDRGDSICVPLSYIPPIPAS